MKNFRLFLAVAIISLVMVCCHSVSLLPTQVDVPLAQAHWQNTTLDELTKGYNIYASKCTQCHDMKNPKDFSVDDWNDNYMPSMGKKAQLNDTEYQLVLHYILAKREELVSAKK